MRRDGSELVVEMTVAAVTIKGEPQFSAFVRDITERKRTERQVAEQLAELQRWQRLTLGREDRFQQLKREVNELQSRLNEPPRYPSQTEAGSSTSTSVGDASAVRSSPLQV